MLWGFATLVAYPQSKLVGAGKAAKVGSTTGVKKNSSSPNRKKPVASKNMSVKPNARLKFESSAFMEIIDIKFANSDSNSNIIDKFGSKLYASDVKYLKPQISYNGLASEENKVSLFFKIIKEDGSLKQGTLSPEGYTYKQDITVKPGNNQAISLSGYGTNEGGSYSPGEYTYEIWYKNNLLYQKKVRLYSGTTPLVSNGMLKIKKITFGSENSKGDENIPCGATLYEGDVKFLIGNMYYEGCYSNEQKVTFYSRIYFPGGNMSHGDSSPFGYSYKRDITIKPGENVYKISGWGNESGSIYKEGTHKYEIWIDSEKIYETTFEVIKKSSSTSYLTVNEKTAESTTFTSSGGSEKYYVKTDASSWELWGVPTWCKITEKTATTFTLTCSTNNGVERTDWMKVKADGKEVRIDLKQFARSRSVTKTSSGSINGHDYVDLGLPSGTKWATCNVGATRPEECGNYYAWGETATKTNYTHANSKYYKKTKSWLQGQNIIDYFGNLKSNYDPASKYWSSSWRTPTAKEMSELVDKCKWVWTELNGMCGFNVIGPNGNKIFLPASGWYNSVSSGTLDCFNERSEYWTSTIVSDDIESSHCLFFMKENTYYAGSHCVQRSRGLCVRPVSK